MLRSSHLNAAVSVGGSNWATPHCPVTRMCGRSTQALATRMRHMPPPGEPWDYANGHIQHASLRMWPAMRQYTKLLLAAPRVSTHRRRALCALCGYPCGHPYPNIWSGMAHYDRLRVDPVAPRCGRGQHMVPAEDVPHQLATLLGHARWCLSSESLRKSRKSLTSLTSSSCPPPDIKIGTMWRT